MGFCSSLATPVHFTLRMLFYSHELTKALADRFTDTDEIIAVANYGCSGGVSGFTYLKETSEFFDEFEDDVEDVCFDILGDDYLEKLAKCETSILGLKNKLVWLVVEQYCTQLVNQMEEEEASN